MISRRRLTQAAVFIGVELGLLVVPTVSASHKSRKPRPSPTPVPTPTPTPSTTDRTVPPSIDATGTTDVTAALNQWVAAQPDGSHLIFPSGSRYKLTQGINVANRKDLEFVGEGCTLDQAGGYSQMQSIFLFGHTWGGFWGGLNERIKLHGFTLLNHNPTPGVFSGAREQAHAVEVEETAGIEIWGITAQGIGGDLMKVGHSTDVLMRDCHATDVGRQGLSVISGQRITMDRCTIDRYGYYAFDVEPNYDTESCLDVWFTNNTLGSGAPDTGVGAGFAACGSGTAYLQIGRIHVTDNTISGSANSTLTSYFNQNQHRRLFDIEFSRNRSAQAGGAAEFKDIDRLTIIGNTAAGAPLTITTPGCTAVVTG